MFSKRGLSNVVATVLIILLALAAIAILWSFVGPTITDYTDEIDTTSKCLNSELKPTSCTFFEETGSATVVVQLVRGETEKMKIILTDNNGQTDLSTESLDTPTNPFETVTADATGFTDIDVTATPIKAQVVATFVSQEGTEEYCAESPISFNCEIIPTP